MRNYQLLRHLGQHHDVTLVTYASPQAGAAEALQPLCERVVLEESPPDAAISSKRRRQLGSLISPRSYHSTWLLSGRLQKTLDGLIRATHFDLVQIESSMMAAFDVSENAGVLVIDEHNIEYEGLFRSFRTESSVLRKLYYLAEYAKCRREEIASWHRADGCALTSAREEAILREEIPAKPTAVVPNAVDAEYFRPSGAPSDPDEIVFTGLMSYRPNVDAAIYFVRKIFPRIRRLRPTARFSIVGADPPAEVTRLASSSVRVTGAVSDVRPYLDRARVVVVPVRFGSGTRLKVAEGLAMAKAVVSTSVGAEGIDVRAGEHLLIADDPRLFAEEVVRLSSTPRVADDLGAAGRAFALAHLTWKASAARLETFHEQLLDRQAAFDVGRSGPTVAAKRMGTLSD